jgi:hypothetical protein
MTETRQRNFKIGRLTTQDQIVKELGRVYRHARRGEIDSSKAYRSARCPIPAYLVRPDCAHHWLYAGPSHRPH